MRYDVITHNICEWTWEALEKKKKPETKVKGQLRSFHMLKCVYMTYVG